jgi:hypothetical protein
LGKEKFPSWRSLRRCNTSTRRRWRNIYSISICCV